MINDIETRVMKLIQASSGGKSVSAETRLLESGILDSFGIIQLIGQLEEEFQISLPGEALTPEHFATAQSIAGLIRRTVAA